MTWTATVLVNISPPSRIWKARAHVLWTSGNRYYVTLQRVSASTTITCVTSAAKIWIFPLNDIAEEHERICILSGQVFLLIAFMLNWTTTERFWFSKCFMFFSERINNSGSGLFCLRHLRAWGWSGVACTRDQVTSFSRVDEVFRILMLNSCNFLLLILNTWEKHSFFPTETHLWSKYHGEKRH